MPAKQRYSLRAMQFGEESGLGVDNFSDEDGNFSDEDGNRLYYVPNDDEYYGDYTAFGWNDNEGFVQDVRIT